MIIENRTVFNIAVIEFIMWLAMVVFIIVKQNKHTDHIKLLNELENRSIQLIYGHGDFPVSLYYHIPTAKRLTSDQVKRAKMISLDEYLKFMKSLLNQERE